MHHIITILIIIAVALAQRHFYVKNKKLINLYAAIFPKEDNGYKLKEDSTEQLIDIIKETSVLNLMDMIENAGLSIEDFYVENSEDELDEHNEGKMSFDDVTARAALIAYINEQKGISSTHNNAILKRIISSINSYLNKNKTVSDFHLLKDIVDRNTDALEDEISTQIPTPQYLGLGGTMLGILVGIMTLWLSGGIGDIISISSDSNGIRGIEGLLGGVGLAMVSSIIGITLTTLLSTKFKNAKAEVERNKHTFLSWIQANLLPTLSDNVVGAIQEMGVSLEYFNSQFSDNTSNLAVALGKVNESYALQVELIDTVNQVRESDTATANLRLFKQLTESTKEIRSLAEFLSNTTEYLEQVKTLNEKIGKQEDRVKTFENLGLFFQQEIKEIEGRKAEIAKSVGKVDDYLQQTFQTLKDNTEEQFKELQKANVKNQQLLLDKSDDVEMIIKELEQLPSIKKSAMKFEQTVEKQNQTILVLAKRIEELANTKADFPALSYNDIAPPSTGKDKKIIQYILLALLSLIALSTTWIAIKPFISFY